MAPIEAEKTRVGRTWQYKYLFVPHYWSAIISLVCQYESALTYSMSDLAGHLPQERGNDCIYIYSMRAHLTVKTWPLQVCCWCISNDDFKGRFTLRWRRPPVGWLYSSPTSVTRSRFGCQLRWVHFFGPPRFGPLMIFFGFFAKFGFYSPELL